MNKKLNWHDLNYIYIYIYLYHNTNNNIIVIPLGRESVLLKEIMPSIEVTLNLKSTIDRYFNKLEIKKDCRLREAVEYESKIFKRGHAYYEFTHEKESISEDKELIFMNKVVNLLIHYVY